MAQKISINLGVLRTAKGNKTPRAAMRGESGVPGAKGATQHGELPGSMDPVMSEKERLKDDIQYQKRNATRDWVAGRITTSEHKAIHDRANHAMSSKPVHKFRGKSGERKIKGLY